MSHHYRASSPGSRKLAVPGRSSTNTIGSSSSHDPYYSSSAYSRSPREPVGSYGVSKATADRVGGGVIPISTETYVTYAPSSSSRSSGADTYSGRPRRSTLTDDRRPDMPLRTRPTSVVHGSSIARPSSPLSRQFDPDVWVKPSPASRREHKKLYSVDAGSAKLIAETDTDPQGPRNARSTRAHRDDSDRARERHGHRYSGSSRGVPPSIDESYSYTDAAGMYRDTEPSWRSTHRRSVDRGGPRRTSGIYDAYDSDQFGPPRRSSTAKEGGPPPSTRGFDKVNEALFRGGSTRHPSRSLSRERNSTYDAYRNDDYYAPRRSSSAARKQPDEVYRYRQDNAENKDFRSRKAFHDDYVESRGFGIRSGSVDEYGSSSIDTLDNRRPATIAPVPTGPAVGGPAAPPPSVAPYGLPLTGHVAESRPYMAALPPQSQGRYAAAYDDDRRFATKNRENERDHDRTKEGDHYRDVQDHMSASIPVAAATSAGVAGGVALKELRGRRQEEDSYDRQYERERPKPSNDSSPILSVPPGTSPPGRSSTFPHRQSVLGYDETQHRHGSRSLIPNEREDVRELEYAQKDKHDVDKFKDRDKVSEPALDPDEEYRRRVQQAQLELNSVPLPSTRSDRSDDSDRERRRRRRKERARDRESDPSSADDEDIGQKDVTPRSHSMGNQSTQQHHHPSSTTEKAIVQSPVGLEREATVGATPAAGGVESGRDKGENRVRIVEPPKGKEPEPPLKGILRRPTEKFPEDPNPIREGVAPLKDSKKDKNIPDGARWTKIDRRLVNPQALEEANERFEERLDCVIVLRVLTRDEIQKFADRTRQIRDERERHERDHRKRRRRSHHSHDEETTDETSSASERDERRSSDDRRSSREYYREHEHDRGRERDRHRDSDYADPSVSGR